ncbi:MAG: hypothetical protein M1836_007505 [Candelina mexicana]|nr:MAG: hypothetical protein M1836_007505 [Candelina mexicana]
MADTPNNRKRFPELFKAEKNQIDRRTCRRVVPMQVLAVGLPRTGTSSLRAALKQLGYDDVHHMESVFTNPQEAVMWREAAEAKWFGVGKPFGRKEFDMLLGHCQATCDWPSAAFYEELITAYPEAKVILNTRDIDAWYKSMTQTVMKEKPQSIQSFIWPVLGFFDISVLAKINPFLDKLSRGSLNDQPFSVAGKDMFIKHHEGVRALVPKDRLLEFTVRDGWEPLCKFLGRDVPDTPFPRVNDTAEFGERINVVVGLAIRRVVRRLLPVLGGVVALLVATYSYNGFRFYSFGSV